MLERRPSDYLENPRTADVEAGPSSTFSHAGRVLSYTNGKPGRRVTYSDVAHTNAAADTFLFGATPERFPAGPRTYAGRPHSNPKPWDPTKTKDEAPVEAKALLIGELPPRNVLTEAIK